MIHNNCHCKSRHIVMVYNKSLTISQMKEVDLFDDIEYKYFKNLNDDNVININIQIIDKCDTPGYVNALFIFELKCEVLDEIVPYICVWEESEIIEPCYHTKRFTVKKTYNTSSGYAMMISSYVCDDNQ
jgi:hypothetical protein